MHATEVIEGTIVGGMTYRTAVPWTVYLPRFARNHSFPNRHWDT